MSPPQRINARVAERFKRPPYKWEHVSSSLTLGTKLFSSLMEQRRGFYPCLWRFDSFWGGQTHCPQHRRAAEPYKLWRAARLAATGGFDALGDNQL